MITAERLRELLRYNSRTGRFKWRKNAGAYGRIKAGTVAGGPNKEGYWYVYLDGRSYFSPHLVWLYVHGVWPTDTIDHRNRRTGDDRIGNLRIATASQNKANSSLYRNNTSGFKGVSYERARDSWVAFITSDGKKRKWLGRFKTREEAFAAYCEAAREIFGEFASPERSHA